MLDRFNKTEIKLIESFKSHTVFKNINDLKWNDFLSILIQRRFISKSIINIYEEAIDLLSDKEVKKVARSLVKEEFPRNSKGDPLSSHRELLIQDLLSLGASREQIFKSSESEVTKNTIKECINILSKDFGEDRFELGLITALRFMTEVLVAEEYRCLWGKMEEKLSSNVSESNRVRSEFYYFHMIHDDRGSDIGQKRGIGGISHAEQLAHHMYPLISSEDDVNYCISIEKKVFDIKYKFYDQFTF
jgi:uncharacterized membrane protein YheB (UPF0754 family)